MRRVGAIALCAAVLTASALAGCGGGSGTSGTRPAVPPPVRPSPAALAIHREKRLQQLEHVEEAELVGGRAGWARDGIGVWWTSDGGRHWRRITPPASSPLKIEGVYFRDRRRGWAFAEEGHEGDTHPVFFSTVDGGRHWRRSPTPIGDLLLPAAAVSFSAVGDRLVFALVRQSGDTASNTGFLLRSDDGGGSWHRVGRIAPQAGRIVFESARDGWLAGDFPAPELWRTHDGGRTWTEARLPSPPGVTGIVSNSFLPPRIGVDGQGLLAGVSVPWSPSLSPPRRPTVAVLYSTSDRGRHWQIAATKTLSKAGGTLEAPSVLAFSGNRTVLVRPPAEPRLTVLTAAGRGPSYPAAGLTEWSEMSFSGRRLGFAYSSFGRDRALLFTTDGGRDWHRVASALGTPPAAEWAPCLARRAVRVHGVYCTRAGAVLRRYLGSGPRIRPGPSPAGWRCHQTETAHTSDGGDAYLVVCRLADHPKRGFSYRWTSG